MKDKTIVMHVVNTKCFNNHQIQWINLATKIQEKETELLCVLNCKETVRSVIDKIKCLSASGPDSYLDIVFPWLDKTIEEALRGDELTILNKHIP